MQRLERVRIFRQSAIDFAIGTGAGIVTKVAARAALLNMGFPAGTGAIATVGASVGFVRAAYKDINVQAEAKITAEQDAQVRAMLRERLSSRIRRIREADKWRATSAGARGAIFGSIGAVIGAEITENIINSDLVQNAWTSAKEWVANFSPLESLRAVGFATDATPSPVLSASEIEDVRKQVIDFEKTNPLYLNMKDASVAAHIKSDVVDNALNQGLKDFSSVANKEVLRGGAKEAVLDLLKDKYDEFFMKNVLKNGGVIRSSDIVPLRDEIIAQFNNLMQTAEFQDSVTKAANFGAQQVKDKAEAVGKAAIDAAAQRAKDEAAEAAKAEAERIVQEARDQAAADATARTVKEASPAAPAAANHPSGGVGGTLDSHYELSNPQAQISIPEGSSTWNEITKYAHERRMELSGEQIREASQRFLIQNGVSANNVPADVSLKMGAVNDYLNKLAGDAFTQAETVARIPGFEVSFETIKAPVDSSAWQLLELKGDAVLDSPKLGAFVDLNFDELKQTFEGALGQDFPATKEELADLIKAASSGDKDAYAKLKLMAKFFRAGSSMKIPKMLAMAVAQ